MKDRFKRFKDQDIEIGNSKAKRFSLYLEWTLLLVFAGTISILFFTISQSIFEETLDNYWSDRRVVKKHNAKKIESLQEYVTEFDVNSTDRILLDNWCALNREVVINIFDGYTLQYSSEYGTDDLEELAELGLDVTAGVNDAYYDVQFTNGVRRVLISGMYSYDSYMMAVNFDIVTSFIIFFVITILGVRERIKYINRLSEDVLILEGGDLGYEVTVQGKDELSELASGINSLRLSLKQQMSETENALSRNQQMITEISHDLRTPLTAILLYAEILQNGKMGEKEQKEYLEKLIKKVQQMKNLSDNFLEYSLDNNSTQEMYKKLNVKSVLFDELSDMCSYLEAQGYHVDASLKWDDGKIRIGADNFPRVLDNIASNIMKYANKEEAIRVWDEYSEFKMSLFFENSLANKNVNVDTHGIGIRSICNIMSEYGGECIITENDDTFRICLQFEYEK